MASGLISISKDTVKRLLDIKVGDSGRLNHILETMEKGKTLYRSDQKYLSNLISHYLGITAENQQHQGNVLSELVQSHIPGNISANCRSMLSTFFNMKTTKFSNASFFLARFGLAFVFAWQGYSMFTNPQQIADVLSQVAGITSGFALNVTMAVGAIEAIGGVLLLAGFLTRLVTFTQIILLIATGIVFGMDFVNGPSLWKDVGLLGLALMLFMLGSGKWSLDYLISRKVG